MIIPNPPKVSAQSFSIENCEVYFTGKELHKGPLPALFYFSLTGKESLELDPYNQLVAFLQNQPFRIFSLSLPFHGPDLDPKKAIEAWAHSFATQQDCLAPFINKTLQVINYLIEHHIIHPHSIAISGLSRGAYLATLIAAQSEHIHSLLGFAPLTSLQILSEFAELQNNSLLNPYLLENSLSKLVKKNIYYFIGNRDKRVDTTKCFQFISKISEYNYQQGIRSPPCLLKIYPSIGYLGHGTPSEIFYQGSLWIKNKLLHNTSSD